MTSRSKIIIAILVIQLLTTIAACAQTGPQPRLKYPDRPVDYNQTLHTDGKTYYYVENVAEDRDLPLQPNTMIAVYSDRELTTKRLKETDIQTLTISSLGEVNGKFSKYVEVGRAVTVEFRGKSAGFIRQSYIEIDIKSAVVQLNRYTKIGVRNGVDVLLPPGIYRLTLTGRLRNFQFSGLFNYNLPPEGSTKIKRGFGAAAATRPFAKTGLIRSTR